MVTSVSRIFAPATRCVPVTMRRAETAVSRNVADSHEQAVGPVALHVLTRLVLGGPSRPVLCSLDGLARGGWRPVLLAGAAALHEEERLELLDAAPAVPLLRVPTLVRDPAPRRDAAAVAVLRDAIRRLAPALVHGHTAKAGALLRVAARGRVHRPVVFHTYHGHSLTRAASGRRAPLWRVLERLLAPCSDRLIAVSPGQREELARLLGARAQRRLVTLPLAFDPAAYTAPDPGEERRFRLLALRPGMRTLAFVGRGVPVKGLGLLATACRRLAALDPWAARRLRIAVIGPVDPPVRADIEQTLAGADQGPAWVFFGSSLNPLPLVGAADGLVLPSLSEGTPVSVLEALYLGKPVLAAAVGGVPELLATDWRYDAPGQWRTTASAPRGTLLPPGAPEAWADALARFVADPLAVAGAPQERRRFVTTTFAPHERTRELAALYAACGVEAPATREDPAADRDTLKGGPPRPRPPAVRGATWGRAPHGP